MLDMARPQMQRTRGRADVVLGARGLVDLHQSGSAKAILPRMHGAAPEVVFLNTAGGLTGGDNLHYGLTVHAGLAVATTQTAERAYASIQGAAKLQVDLEAGPGVRLDWLPQETILFEGSSLARTTCVKLATDARFLMVETVVLGRAAMGETLQDVVFTDLRRIERAGVPVMIEPLRLDARVLARRDCAVTLGGARAFCTIALITQGAEDALGAVRAQLAGDGVTAAASAWDGKLVIRAMASDAYPLRRAVARILTTLRGAPLPRVWQA